MKNIRKEIYQILDEERNYQDKKWGGAIHDKNHSTQEWLFFIRKYLNDADNAIYNNNEVEAKIAIKKITAIGVAFMEVNDVPKRIDKNEKD